MFERLRAAWASLLGARAAPAPPVVSDPEALARAREGLERLRERSPDRFHRCFLRGRPLGVRREERPLLEDLASLGLVTRLGPSIGLPRVRLFPLYGRVVATDLLTHRGPDQVFSLMFEQVYLIRNMQVEPGEDVLEIGVGSGANALFAADSARRVTGVDVNPRALAFARFNLALNPVPAPVDLREGSLFAPLEPDRRFDRILVNPPFEPVPPGTSGPLHSDGGEDGLDVVRGLLAEAPRRLSPKGHLVIVTWSPGPPEGAHVADLVRRALPDHALDLHLLAEGPLAPVLERHAQSPGFEAWRERLASRGWTHLFFVFLRARPSEDPRLEVLRPRDEVRACHEIADAWL